ncbi:MAG: gamma carbonic anhydrase family protein [Rhodospirillales bacterium]|nr:gamma carbonic anhydrase family protein [Rhodospirillales bacterium]
MSGLILPYRGRRPRIADDAFVAENATVIGDVEVGARANLWFGVVVRGDMRSIRIGARTNVQDGSVIHVSSRDGGETVIGDDVTIGHLALIHACTLEDGCFIGMKACVMDRAVVEGGALVAAGALITPGKRVKRGELWGGSPARFLRAVNDEEKAYMTALPERYARLGAEYKAGASAVPGEVGA